MVYIYMLWCWCRSPWTLAVCVVLLPVVGQLLSSQREPGHVAMLAGMVLMTVQRFSVTILACRGNPYTNIFSCTTCIYGKVVSQLHACHVLVYVCRQSAVSL